MNSPSNELPKVLVLTTAGYFPPFIEQSSELHSLGKTARVWLLEIPSELTILDQRFLTNPPKWLRAFYCAIPIWAAHALEAFRVRRHYDVVFSWGAESVAMPFALLLKITGTRIPFVTLFNWVSPAKKAVFLRLVHSHITKLIIPPSVQRAFAMSALKIPDEKIVDIPWCVDEEFWQSTNDVKPDMICSVGREMRDYETLIKALDGTRIRCHIAGALVRGKNDRWRRTIGDWGDLIKLPENVTMSSRDPVQLRELYARSRFVVLPLHQSDTDNGITCMLEAWSMGRPVICSQVDGQRDTLADGRNGVFVPVGDVRALRKAIVDLWASPEESAMMGREGRRTVEEHYRLDRFVREVSKVIQDAAAGTENSRSGILSH
jgi:glycosyltransferase involved in cell wall biosynthesis